MARQHGEPHGKTECWYVLEAEPDATVALGLRPGTSLPDVKAAIDDHTLENLLQSVPVRKDEMIFVDAGTVHAIFPGVVMLETQQNSDMTYRLYDYGRPRELHLKDGLQAIRLKTEAGPVAPKIEPISGSQSLAGGREILVQSKYFRVDRTLPGRFEDGKLFAACREKVEHSAVGVCWRGRRATAIQGASQHSAAAWGISGRACLQPRVEFHFDGAIRDSPSDSRIISAVAWQLARHFDPSSFKLSSLCRLFRRCSSRFRLR